MKTKNQLSRKNKKIINISWHVKSNPHSVYQHSS